MCAWVPNGGLYVRYKTIFKMMFGSLEPRECESKQAYAEYLLEFFARSDWVKFQQRYQKSNRPVRQETYSKALAEIVNHQHSFPFSGHWGAGTTSSSDGQYFHVGGRGEHALELR
jgi:hypothetical protein